MADDTVVERQVALDPAGLSAREARTFVRDLLLESHREEWLDAAQLAVSEVVTNVVLHARTTMTLHVRWGRHRLRIEVTDCSPAMLRPRRATRRSEHGRGLLLLDRLADDWGVTEHHDTHTCKTVWFEVTRETENDEADDPDLHAAFDPDTVDAL